jgi:predicted nuclease with TOPRIM domain
MSSTLRLKLDRLEKENRGLRKERGQQARRIYHLRIEVGELVRQVQELKDDDRTKETLRKEVKGCNKTLRSERYIHGRQLARIEQVVCDDEDCGCCVRLRAALPSGGPFRPSREQQGEGR